MTKEEKKEYNYEYFQRNKDRLQKYQNKRRQKVRKLLINIKHNMGCSICNENNSAYLVFHHSNPCKEDLKISHINSVDSALEEINKCIVLCESCHNRIHHRREIK